MFSPDGSSLLFQWKVINRDSIYADVFVMDLKTRKVRKITSLRHQVSVDPSFSHDGSEIVFSTLEYFSNTPKLWIVKSDGSNLHAVDF
jgi:Tol biopolymer transport system component